MSSESLTASCHCGAISVTIARKPDFINDCNCSFCLKCGGAWGYYETGDCTITGDTQGYTRVDYPDPVVQIQFCKTCGATTHWVLTESYKSQNPDADKMGVNMRLFNHIDLTGIELRFPDGENWFGESDYGYRRDPITLTADFAF